MPRHDAIASLAVPTVPASCAPVLPCLRCTPLGHVGPFQRTKKQPENGEKNIKWVGKRSHHVFGQVFRPLQICSLPKIFSAIRLHFVFVPIQIEHVTMTLHLRSFQVYETFKYKKMANIGVPIVILFNVLRKRLDRSFSLLDWCGQCRSVGPIALATNTVSMQTASIPLKQLGFTPDFPSLPHSSATGSASGKLPRIRSSKTKNGNKLHATFWWVQSR